MKQMDPEALQEHINLLREQVNSHQRRLQNLYAAQQRGQSDKQQQRRIKRLEEELDRLNVLVTEGVRLAGKAGQPGR
jgi:multidrug resistance efflux pump